LLKFGNNQPKYERKHGRMNKKVRVTLTTIQPPMETHFFSGKGGVAEVIEFSIFVPKKNSCNLEKGKKKKVWCDVRNGKKKSINTNHFEQFNNNSLLTLTNLII
jgi:hypothetical protein